MNGTKRFWLRCGYYGWATAFLLGIIGCKPGSDTKGHPTAAEMVVSNVADVLTQRQAVQAGQRAKEIIRRVSDERNADLKEAMENP